MNTDKVKYALGDIVYLRIKPDVVGMVTAIVFRPNGVTYYVTWSNDMVERSHYLCEITAEKSYALSDA